MYKLFQYVAFSSLFSSSCIVVSFQLISLLPLLPPSRLLLLEVRHIFLCTAMEEWVLLMDSHYFSQTSFVEYVTSLYIKDTEFSDSDYKF